MNSINIYWGPDTVFEQATSGITVPTYLQDVLTHIGRAEIIIPGLTRNDEDSKPMEVEDLLIFTDDYGALREWALLGFTKNVLENLKVHINNIWLNNPPQPIYDDILRNNPEKIIKEHHRSYLKIEGSEYDYGVLDKLMPAVASPYDGFQIKTKKDQATAI